jgi:hypothetical protein
MASRGRGGRRRRAKAGRLPLACRPVRQKQSARPRLFEPLRLSRDPYALDDATAMRRLSLDRTATAAVLARDAGLRRLRHAWPAPTPVEGTAFHLANAPGQPPRRHYQNLAFAESGWSLWKRGRCAASAKRLCSFQARQGYDDQLHLLRIALERQLLADRVGQRDVRVVNLAGELVGLLGGPGDLKRCPAVGGRLLDYAPLAPWWVAAAAAPTAAARPRRGGPGGRPGAGW